MTVKILIVDDDQVDRQIVKRALKIGNVSVEISEAETVDEGLEVYASGNFDLVLLDYRLPGKDGIEMLMSLRESQRLQSTAIVMMSNSEEDSVAMEAIQSGAQDFLMKSEISASRLKRAILQAQTRFELEQKLHESYKKVKQLAERDSLTGLANRYLFDENLKISISSNSRQKSKVALILIDLDQFKYVNDNFGHDIGDLLLQRVVARIHSCLRGNEVFARLGGDEFAITLTQLKHAEDAKKVAERVLTVLRKPFEIEGHSLTTGASIGIAISPDDAKTAEQLFKFADIAMYRAKHQGRNQCCFFEREMQQHAEERFQVEQELREAVRDKKLRLLFQPIVSAGNCEVYGFEALIYWHEAQGAMRSPMEFIPVAEESNLILELGRWVIEAALRQLGEWNFQYQSAKKISINLSAMQVTDDGLVDFIANAMEQNNIPRGTVVFELTESAMLDVSEETIAFIEALHSLGCQVALDDFGTGFSSISHLREFPIDIVKIDRSIVPGSGSTAKQVALFKSLVEMVKCLELQVVAEGVETEIHQKLCDESKVDFLQGYHYSRPVSPNVIEREYFQ